MLNNIFRNAVINIVKKEIMDSIRNKWFILITLIFLVLVVLISYVDSYGQSWGSLGAMISLGLMSVVHYFVPIIGLMLGYGAIVGEVESGSMSSLLSQSVTRTEIILGKFFGRGLLLASSIVIGFGIGAIAIAVNISDVDYFDYFIFVGATILLGLVFFTIGLFLSPLFKKRYTAIGGSIFIWVLYALIWPIIMSIILFTVVVDINLIVSGGELPEISIPIWYEAIDLFSPITAYTKLVSLTVAPVSSLEGAFLYSVNNPGLMAGILLVWIAVFLFLGFLGFRRKDI